MTGPINNYTSSCADWRNSLRTNNRRTTLVITVFFCIYLLLGLLLDCLLYTNSYPDATLKEIITALLTLHITPHATLVCLGVAALSLFLTLTFSDQLMLLGTDYRGITPESANTTSEKQLYNIVEEMKIAAGLQFLPKIYIIEAEYMNAFASGFSEKSAMLAITQGLINNLNREELQAVVAHELSHIRHMDIKLTLVASVLANSILIMLDVLTFNARVSNQNSKSKARNALFIINLILRCILPLINTLLLLYLSRTREYMADAGAVELMRDNQPLATALLKINYDYTEHEAERSQAYPATAHEHIRRQAYIFDPVAGAKSLASLADLFSTHPSIADRLNAIGYKQISKSD